MNGTASRAEGWRRELLLPLILFSSMGAASWQAVRISGEGCGWTMGLLFGLAWLFLSAANGERDRRLYGGPWIVLACVAGFYMGGMHGYGQFHVWVKGVFELSRAEGRTVPLSPLVGYWWEFLCGAGWGGAAGVCMAWAATGVRVSAAAWAMRIAFAVGCAWLFLRVAEANPAWIMPLYDSVNYADAAECQDCARTVPTLNESLMWIGLWVGGLLAEALRRNGKGVALIAVMGLGFGVAFTLFEWLHAMPTPGNRIEYWWPFWESSVGLVGGAVMAGCYFYFNRPSGEAVRGRGLGAAPWLIGLWAPLLGSLHYVLPYRIARGIRWTLGTEDEAALREDLSIAILVILIPAAVAVIVWTAKRPAVMLYAADPRFLGRLFIAVYALYFLVSYLPRFALAIEGGSAAPTQALYGVAFVISIAAFWALYRRASHAGTA